MQPCMEFINDTYRFRESGENLLRNVDFGGLRMPFIRTNHNRLCAFRSLISGRSKWGFTLKLAGFEEPGPIIRKMLDLNSILSISS